MEPPDTRVLFPSPVETPDPLLSREAVSSPLPNLTPRHQELIPTPCGPIKPWAELSSPVKIYFCITIISLLSIIGLTIENLVQQKDEDFPVSLIQLIGVVFCIYYLSRGILQENRQELSVFILSIALVMLRSVVNFTVLPARQKPKLLARFVLILMVGAFDVICAAVLMQSDSRMAFRVGGALESLQAQYFMLNLCFSMLTFDLQAQPGDLRLAQRRLGRRDSLGRLEGHLRHPCDLERIKASRLDFSGPEFTGSGLSRLLALQGRNRVGPREFVRPGSRHHHLLLHFRGDQECPLWGVVPRVPKLWTRTERKDVFFLWKDRFMKGTATPSLATMLL